MTRVYATCKLLEHGPLTFKEFRIITGWTVPQCRHALALAIKNDRVYCSGQRGKYRLAVEVEC